MLVVLSLAVVAALAMKVPELFGFHLGPDGAPFYARNASLFVLPPLTGYFAWKRGLDALLAFLGTMVWTGSPISVEREVLISFDLLPVVVVGLVLYAASARDPSAPPDFFDGLQLLLVASALAVDSAALASVAARISEFGLTPNRAAALGENLILLVNLSGSAWLYARFLRDRGSFAALERWQIAFLPVYSFWALLVVAIFPPVFGYR